MQQTLSTPSSNLRSHSIAEDKQCSQEVSEEDQVEEYGNDISSENNSVKNIKPTNLAKFTDSKEVFFGTQKGQTWPGGLKNTIEHFSKPLTQIQKKDLKRLYVTYLKEQFFMNKTPSRKVIIESPCEILNPLSNCKGLMCMTNYELIFFYEMDTSEGEQQKSTIFFFEQKITDTKGYQKVISLSFIKEI